MKGISIEDRGFRHGLGVFETVPVVKGKALFAQRHWQVLLEGAGELGIPLDGIQMPGAPGASGIWRWFATDTGLHEWFEQGEPFHEGAVELKRSPLIANASGWDFRFKTLSYLTHVQARRLAGEGCEALLLNERGEVATASMANVFWVKDGVIHTPARECGCRAGVTRSWVLEQEEVVQGAFGKEELLEADEVFLTNSRIGIAPVKVLEGRTLGEPEVAALLRKRYCACVKQALC